MDEPGWRAGFVGYPVEMKKWRKGTEILWKGERFGVASGGSQRKDAENARIKGTLVKAVC
jgi:hypothetical protein